MFLNGKTFGKCPPLPSDGYINKCFLPGNSFAYPNTSSPRSFISQYIIVYTCTAQKNGRTLSWTLRDFIIGDVHNAPRNLRAPAKDRKPIEALYHVCVTSVAYKFHRLLAKK